MDIFWFLQCKDALISAQNFASRNNYHKNSILYIKPIAQLAG